MIVGRVVFCFLGVILWYHYAIVVSKYNFFLAFWQFYQPQWYLIFCCFPSWCCWDAMLSCRNCKSCSWWIYVCRPMSYWFVFPEFNSLPKSHLIKIAKIPSYFLWSVLYGFSFLSDYHLHHNYNISLVEIRSNWSIRVLILFLFIFLMHVNTLCLSSPWILDCIFSIESIPRKAQHLSHDISNTRSQKKEETG